MAGVSLGLINYHFKNRENLIHEAVRWYVNEEVISEYSAEMQSNGKSLSPIEILAGIIKGPLDYVVSEPELSRISILNDLTSPDTRDNTEETWKRLFQSLIHILKRAPSQKTKVMLWGVIAGIHEAFLRPKHFYSNCQLNIELESDREAYAQQLASQIMAVQDG